MDGADFERGVLVLLGHPPPATVTATLFDPPLKRIGQAVRCVGLGYAAVARMLTSRSGWGYDVGILRGTDFVL